MLPAMRPAMRAVSALVFGAAWLLHGQTASTTAPVTHSGLHRYEAGLQIADINVYCAGLKGCGLPSFALGANGAWNLNQHFAVDVDYLVTPAESSVETNEYGGRASELLAGVRMETRAPRYGFFLKAQPGYFRWSRVITAVTPEPPPEFFQFTMGPRTQFASSLGVGVEYSPTARIHIRPELADLLLRYSGSSWTNNFQPSLAVYYGLGRSIAWRPPVYRPEKTHPFLSPVNGLLLTASTLASTADAVTTQRFLAHGGVEGDPLARPLVKYGWSGQVSLMVLELGSETAGMYGLHRLGQHLAERLVPVSLAALHGYFAYSNLQDH